MAKGFGKQQKEQLGYIILLIPEGKAYAASFDLDPFSDQEDFIGITNDLESVQIWKKKNECKNAIGLYLDFLAEQLNNQSYLEISIRRLYRLPDGKLQDEPEASLLFEQAKH